MSRTCQSRGRFLEKGVTVENKSGRGSPLFGYLTNTTRSHRPPFRSKRRQLGNKNNISYCLLSSLRSTESHSQAPTREPGNEAKEQTAHSKDTSKDGEHTTDCNSDHAHRDSEGLEEEFKLLIGEFGAEVVHKCMDLAQPKHTKCLQERKRKTFSDGIVVLVSATVCALEGGEVSGKSLSTYCESKGESKVRVEAEDKVRG